MRSTGMSLPVLGRMGLVAAVAAAIVFAHLGSAAAQEAPLLKPPAAPVEAPERVPAPVPLEPPMPADYEPLHVADVVAALEDGFEFIQFGEHRGTAERDLVEREFVRRMVPEGSYYAFDFALRDVNGDGLQDLILFPRGVGLEAPEGVDGGLVLVYAFDGESWTKVLESGAMLLGARPSDPGDPEGPLDLALVQTEEYLHYVWRDGAFERRD